LLWIKKIITNYFIQLILILLISFTLTSSNKNYEHKMVPSKSSNTASQKCDILNCFLNTPFNSPCWGVFDYWKCKIKTTFTTFYNCGNIITCTNVNWKENYSSKESYVISFPNFRFLNNLQELVFIVLFWILFLVLCGHPCAVSLVCWEKMRKACYCYPTGSTWLGCKSKHKLVDITLLKEVNPLKFKFCFWIIY